MSLKGGDNMKKEWKKPTLEVLDVKMTMAQQYGPYTDADFVQVKTLDKDIPGTLKRFKVKESYLL